MIDVAVIDSGGANLASLAHALERQGVHASVTEDPATISAADRVILPGVGSAAAIMTKLRDRKLVEVICALRQPVLGICLGMQILFDHSAEGDTQTLGLIPGRIGRLSPAEGLAVPHMGWNTVSIGVDDPLLTGIDGSDWFYFVHSFHAMADSPEVIATTDYGIRFAAIVRRNNFYGVQFHPERSARSGAKLLANFMQRVPCN
jgi:glutamine amidotransferase